MDSPLPPKKRHLGCLITTLVLLALFLTGVGFFIRQVHIYYVGIKNGDVNPILEQKLFSSASSKAASQTVTPQDLQHLVRNGAPEYGPSDAKLTIVEFLDFDCPYCRALAPDLRKAMDTYKDQVHFVFRQFPLEELHPTAPAAALAGLCAHEQGKFLEYYDQLYANPDTREQNDYYRFANSIGLDQTKFADCLKKADLAKDVQTDIQDGLAVGVQGTPTLFFNNVRIQGAPDAQTLDYLIKRFLK